MFGKLFRPKPPEFTVIVREGEREFDLYPVAVEVIACAPEPTGMDALRLADLAREAFFGHYIRVGEYPSSIDREYAKLLIDRVVQWARWQRRGEQFKRTRFKYTLKTETPDQCCSEIAESVGIVFEGKQVNRIPLKSCWQRCNCHYRMKR